MIPEHSAPKSPSPVTQSSQGVNFWLLNFFAHGKMALQPKKYRRLCVAWMTSARSREVEAEGRGVLRWKAAQVRTSTIFGIFGEHLDGYDSWFLLGS